MGIIYSKTNFCSDDEALNISELETLSVTELGLSKGDNAERNIRQVQSLKDITSVIKDFQFFFAEKWKIASDSQGSGNTANIGSVLIVEDILNQEGVFSKLGEEYFDNYWLSYGNPYIHNGRQKKITSIYNYLEYVGELEAKKHLVGRGAKRYVK